MSETIFPASVVKLIDEFRLVINRGASHGVKIGDRFSIYELTDEIKDPETEENLGRLVVPKGTGKVIHVQDKMAIIKSDRTVPEPQSLIQLTTLTPPRALTIPFHNPKLRDKADPIQEN